MTIYEQHGFSNRLDYLKSLADEYNIDLETVQILSSLLGETEDFDGLVSALEDL